LGRTSHSRGTTPTRFEISEPTISCYLHGLRHRGDAGKAKRWLAFLSNHREVIAALDFFTVPTLTFGVLYCFFVIEHGRRRILHFHASAHPTSDWILQQLREAFALPCSLRYVILDRGCEIQPRRSSVSSLAKARSLPRKFARCSLSVKYEGILSPFARARFILIPLHRLTVMLAIHLPLISVSA
jgi:hypothetical protein